MGVVICPWPETMLYKKNNTNNNINYSCLSQAWLAK